MEDPTVRRLAKKVFPYLWVRHKLMSSIPSTGIFPFSEMTVLSQEIGNAVIVYLHMYRPTLSNYLEKHIPSMPQSKMHFWIHVAFLCLQVRLHDDDVFDYFLTTCAITAEVALHCYMSGYDDVLSLASVFFCAFFENELYEGFHKSGGWEGLQRYIEDTLCKELYELVDGYIKGLGSPGDHLPILISIQYEELAARRREKFVSLSSLKIGEIERDDKTNALVSGIFHWYFMENHRLLEAKPGILKRMENVRRKNRSNVSVDKQRHDESSESNEILDAGSKIANSVKPLCLYNEVQSSESVSPMSEMRFNNKATQTLDDSKYTEMRKENEDEHGINYETSDKTKLRSSSLSELRNFFESFSSISEKKTDDSKNFKCNSRTPNTSAVKELAYQLEKINNFEEHRRNVPYPRENDIFLPKNKDFKTETAIKSTEPSHVDEVLSEFTTSFQELGFKCFNVGNSSCLDEKHTNFVNFAEVLEKCRHFQNKCPSIQFVILFPDNCFTNESSHTPEIEKLGENFSKNKYNDQVLSNSSIITEDLKHFSVSSQKPHSIFERTKFETAKIDNNQFRLANGPESLQNCPTENIHKYSKFLVTKVQENNLSSIDKTSDTSRFSITKVNENQILPKDETNLVGGKGGNEPTTISRFRVTKVDENQLKDGTNVYGKDWKNETTKISRFTVTKVNENQTYDGKNISENNWKNGATKISRFTVTKVDESETKDGAIIIRKNWKNETTQIGRFTVKEVRDDQPKSRSRTSLRKSYSTNTTKISRFTVTRVREHQTSFCERNYSISSEVSSDSENETILFQDNGSVKYQKRVSFAEHPLISYYQAYSSDDSSNSITSRKSLGHDSPEDAQSSNNSRNVAIPKVTLSPPTLRNSTVAERRMFFQRFSSGKNQSSSDNARSKTSSGSGFFDKIFRPSSLSSSKMNEPLMTNKKEMDKQKIEELKKSLETSGIENPFVFKI